MAGQKYNLFFQQSFNFYQANTDIFIMRIPLHLYGRLPLFLLPFLTLLVMTFLPTIGMAKKSNIPDELQQWIPWVLYEQEEKICSLETTEATKRFCTWPSHLQLNVREDGADFTQKWVIETRSLVPLPGDSPLWPGKVQVNGKNVIVSRDQGRPALWLDPGKHQVTGLFSWKQLPEHLPVPPETGLVHLTLLGENVENLQLDSQGRLWFRKKDTSKTSSEEELTLQVFRKISDGVPLTQQLRIQLIVSGSPRQITLGLDGSDNFTPLQIHSPLPVRLDARGRLQLQVRPGQWQIQLTLRNTQPLSPETLRMGHIDGPWPTEEIWVFAADPKLRQIEVKGLAAVDPSRTSLPEDWKALPAYLINAGDTMTLNEKNRGTPTPAPNRLQLQRKIWLDERGSGLTVYDTITGIMTQGWRLNVNPQQNLGKVEVEGKARLITSMRGSDKIGVEVRQGRLALHAESRIEKKVQVGQLAIPALGWDHTVQELSAELNLPPGWKLLTASGVDRVSTWLNRWTLLDIFLVLITALATARVLGWGWGSIAILTLVLSFHQPGSPRYLWLPLLALLGLQKIISVGTGERISRISGLLILIAIIVSSVPFMVNEIRTGLYPQLEYGNYRPIIHEDRGDTIVPVREGQLQLMEDETAMSASPARTKARLQKTIAGHYAQGSIQKENPEKSLQIDPSEMIQTGPGLPDWNWRRIHLGWNGPVKPEQEVSFIFLSPLTNSVLAFIRVLLLTLLLTGFLQQCLFHGKKNHSFPSAKTSTLLLLFLVAAAFSPQQSEAETPSPEILQELQDRLLALPDCGQECVSVNGCRILVNDDLLQVELKLDSLIKGAVPLPGKNRFFDQIILNNEAAQIIRLDDQGNSLIRVESGSHTVVLKKDIRERNKISIFFPMPPGNTEAILEEWSINGLHEDGGLDKQITLNRVTPTAVLENDRKEDTGTVHIPAFVRVERTLHMGLKWSVSTRVIRRSPKTVIALDIPLLPGEHVTTDSLYIKDHHVRINMGSDQSVFSYRSAIDPVDILTFTAAETSSWTEVWFLDVSPIWHVTTEGLPEINQTNPAGKRYPEYHPYPGETLQLTISRPEGVPGPTMTISRSRVEIKPGLRATETTLSFSLIASRGLQHSITLPQDIDLQKSLLNGEAFPLQLEDNTLIIPIRPGKQDVQIGWRSERGVEMLMSSEPVELGIASVNASTHMTVPSSRWILLTGGPRIGPAVLFWGELLVIILFALLLGRIKLTPLSTIQWLLLSIGLSQIPAPLAAIVVAWLLLLGLRKKRGKEIIRAVPFNIIQVLLILLSFAALGALFFAIQQGLLGQPDMQIGGNGSYGHSLRWYQDRTDSLLPTAWVVTVPLLAYRITMLLWALWLAMALLQWLRWGWDCFSDTTTWKKSPPKKKKVVKQKRKTVPPTKSVVRKKAPPAQAGKIPSPKKPSSFTKDP